MNAKKAFKDLLFFGSIYYTLITVFILIIASAMSNEDTIKVVETGQFFKILLLSFTMALGSALFRIEAISRIVARAIHAALYISGILVFAVLCDAGFALSAISTAVFSLLYVIVAIITGAIKRKIKK